MLKPKLLAAGATIGVVAPASPAERPSELPRAKHFLEEMGFRVVIAPHVDLRKGFVAASETGRAAEPDRSADRLPLPSALPLPLRGL